MAELLPFLCPQHGKRLETVASATVTCTCGKVCYPPDEFKVQRERALNARRMSRQRTAVSAHAPATTLVPARALSG